MAVPFCGITFSVNSGADYTTGTWTDYAQIRSCTLPKPSVDKDDITTAGSEDCAMEFDPGLIDPGTMSVTLLYDKTVASALNGALAIAKAYKITYSDGSGWKMNGFMSEDGDEGDRGSHIEQTITITISGLPVRFTT